MPRRETPVLSVRLKARRTALGMTQLQLARTLGVSEGFVLRCEQGRRPVTPKLQAWIEAPDERG